MFVVMLVAMYCVAVLAAPHFLNARSYGNFIVDHSTNMATVDVVAIPLLSCETIELTSFVDLASAPRSKSRTVYDMMPVSSLQLLEFLPSLLEKKPRVSSSSLGCRSTCLHQPPQPDLAASVVTTHE